MRNALAAIGGLVIVFVLTASLIVWCVGRTTTWCENKERTLLHPRKACTTFTFAPGVSPTHFAKTMGIPTFPVATGTQSTADSLLPQPSEEPTNPATLVVLRFRASAPLKEVDQWYREKLESAFVRREGWLLQDHDLIELWMRRVETEPSPQAVLFMKQDGRNRDGVLLVAQPRRRENLIVLFRYNETNPLK